MFIFMLYSKLFSSTIIVIANLYVSYYILTMLVEIVSPLHQGTMYVVFSLLNVLSYAMSWLTKTCSECHTCLPSLKKMNYLDIISMVKVALHN